MELKPKIFNIEVEGNTYKIEYTRDALYKADNLGINTDDRMGILEKLSKILYVGLLKHNPSITLKKAGKILDTALIEGYALEDFTDTIIDEYTNWTNAIFLQKSEMTKKITVE